MAQALEKMQMNLMNLLISLSFCVLFCVLCCFVCVIPKHKAESTNPTNWRKSFSVVRHTCSWPEVEETNCYNYFSHLQLATAALLIYSTLAAIYYSKVNPLVSDYDYVDYLSRSFHGRAISEDTADVDDGDEATTAASVSGRTYLSSLANNKWVRTAAYGFQFAMDAIDKVPQ